MRIERIFEKARRVSLKAAHDSHKHGAIILVKGIPISSGFNQQNKTHPEVRQIHPHKTIHAEFAAIQKVKNRDCLKGATMVVFRETKNGIPANSRPCPTCIEILKKYGFSKMVYTYEGSFKEEEIVYDKG